MIAEFSVEWTTPATAPTKGRKPGRGNFFLRPQLDGTTPKVDTLTYLAVNKVCQWKEFNQRPETTSYSRMMVRRNKYLDCLFALDTTFKNHIIDKYHPVNLSNYSLKMLYGCILSIHYVFDV